jgi:cbb3-type cytochrome oxidase maturation protein
MTILYLLIPLAVILMIVAAVFFIWTVRTGQYDDLEGPAHRILMDDDDPMIPGNSRRQDQENNDVAADRKADDDANRERGG